MIGYGSVAPYYCRPSLFAKVLSLVRRSSWRSIMNAQSTTAVARFDVSDEQPTPRPGHNAHLPSVLPEPLQSSTEMVFSHVRRLLRTVREPEVASALTSVGGSPLQPAQLEAELEEALDLHQALKLRYAREYGDQFALAKARALDLRQEASAACRWNLNLRQTNGVLGRITSSNNLEDLRHDLTELHELMLENRSAFAGDQTFDVDAACCSMDKVKGFLAGFSSSAEGELRRLETRREAAVCRVLETAQQVRGAADYALRNQPAERRRLASVARMLPEHVPLRSMIRALSADADAPD